MKTTRSFGIFFLFVSLLIFTNCNRNPFQVDVSKITVPEVKISDYGQALFSLNRDSLAIGLSEIQNKFPLFLGTEPLGDEQVIQLSLYVNDSFLNDLFEAYQKTFPSLKTTETGLAQAFRYIKYYYPKFKTPEVYAYISGIQDPVVYQDNILILGLDNYLGKDCKIYARMGTPRYKMRSMTPDFVLRDAVEAIGLTKIPAPKPGATLLENMIYEGKKIYFIKSMMPELKEEILLKYSSKQLDWFQHKEGELWKYYIANELLYKSDYDKLRKFINDAPFTSVLGDDSAPRTGVWLAYQILKAYAKNTHSSLLDLLANQNAQQILNQSKYKPNR